MPGPGWHKDPNDASQWRYWDGQQWTEHYAPRPPGSDTSTSDDGLVTAGWICAILIPLVGLIIGLVLISRGDSDQGGWIAAVSVAVSLFAGFVLFAI